MKKSILIIACIIMVLMTCTGCAEKSEAAKVIEAHMLVDEVIIDNETGFGNLDIEFEDDKTTEVNETAIVHLVYNFDDESWTACVSLNQKVVNYDESSDFWFGVFREINHSYNIKDCYVLA